MKQLVFYQMLMDYFAQRKTARFAAQRIRSVLARDRASESETSKLGAELSAVLARYFTVMDFSCHAEKDARTNRIFYTLEAELIK
ncbi:MAG: hypothetical protein IJD83_03595 [Clostridia bacterium]|nr:hypothetical protein [Clostridia bacterium]